jgi:hypothetical protein
LLLAGALAVAEPKTLRYRLLHVAGRVVSHPTSTDDPPPPAWDMSPCPPAADRVPRPAQQHQHHPGQRHNHP